MQEPPSRAQRPTWRPRWPGGTGSAPRRTCGAAVACYCTCSTATTRGYVTTPNRSASRYETLSQKGRLSAVETTTILGCCFFFRIASLVVHSPDCQRAPAAVGGAIQLQQLHRQSVQGRAPEGPGQAGVGKGAEEENHQGPQSRSVLYLFTARKKVTASTQVQ